MCLLRMLKLTETVRRNLPLRISLMIGSALSLLLLVSLFIMLYFSRKAMKEDALTKASYSLEQAMTNVDNILLSVEVATGNTYWNLSRVLTFQIVLLHSRMAVTHIRMRLGMSIL